MEHWKVTLEDHEKCASGCVVTKDGEVIGTWAVDEDGFYRFTPNGEQKLIFEDPMIGPFCAKVTEWHEGQM